MERTAKGTFAPGNGGGPGRPKKQREEKFYSITLSTVTFDDWKDIVKKAVQMAKKGDQAARKFLADYLLGCPNQKVDITSNGETLNWGKFVKDAEDDETTA